MEKLKDGRSFMLTALGAVMGLGNALRFPGLCAVYGGGAFIAAYAFALVAVCLPLLCTELALGKRYRAPFPRCMDILRRRSGAVGWAACANSAFVALYYSAIIAYLCVMAANIIPLCLKGGENLGDFLFVTVLHSDSFENLNFSHLTALFLALGWLALYAVLKGGAKSLSRSAKYTVVIPVALFAIMAGRGLIYSNSAQALAALFRPDFTALKSADLWSDAFGQALLSMSLAAGVMPAFGEAIPERCGVFSSAAAIVCANFFGCMLSSVALFTSLYGCGLQEGVCQSGIITAFCLFPAAIAKMFPTPATSGIFGLSFYLSLLLVAVQSALSLLNAMLSPLAAQSGLPRKRVAAFICAAGFFASLIFATNYGRAVLEICDLFACSFNALIIAAAECIILARRANLKQLLNVINSQCGKVKLPYPLYRLQTRAVCPALSVLLAVCGAAGLLACGGRAFPQYPALCELVFGWAASAVIFAFSGIAVAVRLLTEKIKSDKIKVWKNYKSSTKNSIDSAS